MQPSSEPISVADIDRAPADLPAPPGFDYAAEYPKLLERFSKVSEEKFQLVEQLSTLEARNSTRAILDDLIKPYATNVFRFMCVYCGFAGALVTLDGLGAWGFALDESVLQILVGSTAATVIGLVGMVLTGVFVGARGK